MKKFTPIKGQTVKVNDTTVALDDLINYHNQTYTRDDERRIAHQFSRDGFVKIPQLVSKEIKELLKFEVMQLLDKNSERRDLKLATTDNTPRYLSIVRSEMIKTESILIPALSHSAGLLNFLQRITGERMIPAPKKDEEFVITRQEKQGDTHGWHWGDYTYSLIWIVEAPAVKYGGMLQCVPHTSWNKDDARIHEYLTKHPISTYSFVSGDIYLLKADTTLHRTVPLNSDDVTRIMLNMTWGNIKDISKTMEADDRWWDNVDATQAQKVDVTA
ncbi:MAG: ArpA protein [Thiotrichales bacterium]|nr:MAG: ArpA protein [Thiotrichales bacterium]